jgi:hypothetical protein
MVLSPGDPWPMKLWATAYNETYRYQGMQEFAWTSTSTTVPTFNGVYFTLGGLGISASFTGLFDQYRITKLQVMLIPGVTSILEGASDNALLASAVDLDNIAAAASVAALLTKPGVTVGTVCQPHYHSFKPKPLLAGYNGAFTGYMNPTDDVWIDCAYSNLQYYGLKSAADLTNNVVTIKCLVTFDVEFRGISNSA